MTDAAPEQGAGTGDLEASQSPTMEAPTTLADPGKPIVLTVKVFPDGTSQCEYLGEPPWAIGILRAIADGIEEETSDAAQRP